MVKKGFIGVLVAIVLTFIPLISAGAADGPSVASVAPNAGEQDHVLMVDIFGSGLTGATNVDFGLDIYDIY